MFVFWTGEKKKAIIFAIVYGVGAVACLVPAIIFSLEENDINGGFIVPSGICGFFCGLMVVNYFVLRAKERKAKEKQTNPSHQN